MAQCVYLSILTRTAMYNRLKSFHICNTVILCKQTFRTLHIILGHSATLRSFIEVSHQVSELSWK